MPRSHCESDNVQFVQELAEVDGPFESPININFRDLTKLELPYLMWNRGDSCPKKMKITNTGHTAAIVIVFYWWSWEIPKAVSLPRMERARLVQSQSKKLIMWRDSSWPRSHFPVIISGKWKCERPYLTGGPLAGKYVFSQIHFHWGQDDCSGSEHLICGDGFPLEMHVAHFKTEYLTQECALREKDGMVVVVYLFKLQDEPNQSLKKIINLLPNVKQASTSQAIDPRPILTFCNPFSDDYFMYWGSVVTSTCAHILLWIICREPFGISREQVNEFRKIMDSTQQPICKNSRDVQPLHKRNVFHVNASKHLDEPLLPVKKILGCYCKESKENVDAHNKQPSEHAPPELEIQISPASDHSLTSHSPAPAQDSEQCQYHQPRHSQQHHLSQHSQQYHQANQSNQGQKHQQFRESQECCCQAPSKNQEDVEGSIVEYSSGNHCFNAGGMQAFHLKTNLPNDCFTNQTILVQRATVSVQIKRFESEPIGSHRLFDKSFNSNVETQVNLEAKSCCIFPMNALSDQRTEKRKSRQLKRPFNTIRAFSQIMQSLEALKNQTFKKLREIESINQEINGMKSFCQDLEDRQWLRKIEKIMRRQKRFTRKSSKGCLGELRKIAKDCNLGNVLQTKLLPVGDNNGKTMWLYSDEVTKEAVITPKPEEPPPQEVSDGKDMEVSVKAQKLIQSFFEDIDSDDLSEAVKKDLKLKTITSICSKQAGDSNSISSVIKGHITQNMFLLGNLGDRFFTEVSTDDFEIEDNQWEATSTTKKLIMSQEVFERKSFSGKSESPEKDKVDIEIIQGAKKLLAEPMIPLRRTNITVALSKTSVKATETVETLMYKEMSFSDEKSISKVEFHCETDTASSNSKKRSKPKKRYENSLTKIINAKQQSSDSADEKAFRIVQLKALDGSHDQGTASDESTYSDATPKKTGPDSGLQNTFEPNKKSFSSVYNRKSCEELKNTKSKRRKKTTPDKVVQKSSSSREDLKTAIKKLKCKNMTKAKLKHDIKKPSGSSVDFPFDNSMISPKRKKLKLENLKETPRMPKKISETYTKTEGILDEYKVAENYKKGSPKASPPENELSKLSEDKFLKKQMIDNGGGEDATGNIIQTYINLKNEVESVESGTTHVDLHEVKEQEQQGSLLKQTKMETLGPSLHEHAKIKPIIKSRSLSNLLQQPRLLKDISPRLCVEPLSSRGKYYNEMKSKIKAEFSRKTEDKDDSKKEVGEIITSYDDQFLQETTRSSISKETTKIAFNVRYFTATSSPMDESLLLKCQNPGAKDTREMLKRSDSEKHFEKGVHEFRQDFQQPIEDHPDVVHQTDSEKSLTISPFKGVADTGNLSKDLQNSETYLNPKKNSTSRPHSADTLTSTTKSFKRKSKKRPHCCKRSSRHYIRRNPSVFKKSNSLDNKSLNLLSLANEEQLKIISVNIAKYLQQKLVQKNDLGLDISSSKKMTEVALSTKGKPENKAKESANAAKEKETKQNETLASKAKEKQEKKLSRPENKLKNKSLKYPSESTNKKLLAGCALPRPTSNFNKQNKQSTGQSKKNLVASYKKETEPAEKQTLPLQNPPAEPYKFKTKIPRKRVEKSPVQKLPEKPVPESECGIKSQLPTSAKLPVKESRIKQPKTVKKTDLKVKPTTPKESKPPISSQEKEESPEPFPSGSTETLNKQSPILDGNTLSPSNPQQVDLPSEDLTETDEKVAEVKEALFKKDLEYFIQFQMNLNNEVSPEKENPLAVEESTVAPDNCYLNPTDSTSANKQLLTDAFNKGNVLIQSESLEFLNSNFEQESGQFISEKVETSNQIEDPDEKKLVLAITDSVESPEPIFISPANEQLEENYSDSNYDCRISITLNTNFASDSEKEEAEKVLRKLSIKQLVGTPFFPEHSSNSDPVIRLKESTSHPLYVKHLGKKRNESKISQEMKQKLLEILEGEIQKEVEFFNRKTKENSNHCFKFKWKDSEGNIESQSPDSSSDNMDVLVQISDTMKQYLRNLKERGQLVEIINQ